MEVDVMDIGDPQESLRMRNRLERRKLSPLRGDGSWHDDEHDSGGPSEQTADRFASLFLYHALPVLASCGLTSIKAHREYLAGAPLALSPSGGWAMA